MRTQVRWALTWMILGAVWVGGQASGVMASEEAERARISAMNKSFEAYRDAKTPAEQESAKKLQDDANRAYLNHQADENKRFWGRVNETVTSNGKAFEKRLTEASDKMDSRNKPSESQSLEELFGLGSGEAVTTKGSDTSSPDSSVRETPSRAKKPEAQVVVDGAGFPKEIAFEKTTKKKPQPGPSASPSPAPVPSGVK